LCTKNLRTLLSEEFLNLALHGICNHNEKCFCVLGGISYKNYKGGVIRMLNVISNINTQRNLRKPIDSPDFYNVEKNNNILRSILLEKNTTNNSIKRYREV
jgi:hypothetical protein